MPQHASPNQSHHLQEDHRTQEIAYYQGMPTGGCADEDTLRESRLTN